MPTYLLLLIESDEDRKNISDIYEQYKKYLYAIALDISNDLEVADEALSETFVAIIDMYQRIKDYSPDHMKYLLRAILRNKTVDILRLNKQASEYNVELNENTVGEDDIDFDSFGNSVLVDALCLLKDEYKEILIMHYLNEMSIKDISKVLNISYENTKKRLTRARVSLRKNLEESYE